MRIENKNIRLVVEKLVPQTLELVSNIKKQILSTENGRWGKYDQEYFERSVNFDMIKSLEKFITEDLKLHGVSAGVSKKGNLVIYSEWMNGREEHFLNTEVIYAGGHNIQRLHYRYLVKSSLPRIYGSEESKNYKKQITKSEKIRESQNYITGLENRNTVSENKLEINKILTDGQIETLLKNDDSWVTDDFQSDVDWFTHNHGTYEKYLSWIDYTNKDSIIRWKDIHIRRVEVNISNLNNSIVNYKKQLLKLKNK